MGEQFLARGAMAHSKLDALGKDLVPTRPPARPLRLEQ